MCFSAEADFIGGAVVGTIGIATLREARDKRQLPLAALPIAFALHQVVEGVVWLDREGQVSRSTGQAAIYTYLVYAWALLPLLVPLSVLLVEPLRSRRRWMLGTMAIGAIVGGSLIGALMHEQVTARISGHTIVYGGAGAHGDLLTVLYVIATCGAFLLSSHHRIAVFGVLNLLAVLTLAWLKAEALTSVWCAWGAVASVMIYLHFSADRRAAAGAERPRTADVGDGGSALVR
jgi:hypothetical protein